MEKQAVSMMNDSSIICMTSFSLCPTIVRHAPNNCQPHVHQLSAVWPTVVVHCQSRNCEVPTNEFWSVSISRWDAISHSSPFFARALFACIGKKGEGRGGFLLRQATNGRAVFCSVHAEIIYSKTLFQNR